VVLGNAMLHPVKGILSPAFLYILMHYVTALTSIFIVNGFPVAFLKEPT
jgi:hypothetical protein